MSRIELDVLLQRQEFTLDVNLQLPGNGVTVLYGPSGAGKTTLLRCLAGLEKPKKAHISFNGHVWQDGDRFLAAHKRPIGYVFQEDNLFSHLTVRQNLNFAARRADQRASPIKFDDAISLVDIGSLLARYPAELSGGERQRVAITRALLIQPTLLLMDEPLSSLDQGRKQDILPYLEKLKREIELPIIYVTHAPAEVARLADHLVALDDGRAIASGPLDEMLTRLDEPVMPSDEAAVVLEGNVTHVDSQWQLAHVAFPGGTLRIQNDNYQRGQALRLRILARDVSVTLTKQDDTSIVNVIPAVVDEISQEQASGQATIRLRLGDSNVDHQRDSGQSMLVARLTRMSAQKLELEKNKAVWAQIKSVAIVS